MANLRHGALLGLLSVAFLCTSAPAWAQSVTFTPGPGQELEIPPGVATVEATLVGGEGEPGGQCRFGVGSGPGAGGSGALVTATIPVSAGEVLHVDFGGGGAGGTNQGSCEKGGAGGGASEVLSATSTPLVVAGGGGGGGASMSEAEARDEESEHGGAGGNATSTAANGGNAVFAQGSSLTEDEGLGGEGGGPGGGGAGGGDDSRVAAWTNLATAGTLAQGGSGGSYSGAPGAPFIFGGGGGGGGYYGGGGGGAGNLNAGGGGAGASYIDAAGGVTGSAGPGSGQPQAVTLTYTVVSTPPAQAPREPASSPSPTPPATSAKMCVSGREIAIHLADHLTLHRGTKIRRAEVLLRGRLLARLSGPHPVAHVSLAGLPKGSYSVTFLVRTSTGRLLKGSTTFHTCGQRRGAG